MSQRDKLEAAGEEKLNKTMLDLFGDYKAAKAEDIDELPSTIGNIVKNEAEAQKNSLLREAMLQGETGLNTNAYKIDPATGQRVQKTQAEIDNEAANKQINIGNSNIPSTGNKGSTPVVEDEAAKAERDAARLRFINSQYATPSPAELDQFIEQEKAGGKREGRDEGEVSQEEWNEGLEREGSQSGSQSQSEWSEDLPLPGEEQDWNEPTEQEITTGEVKTPLEREREAKGYGPHVTEDDLTVTDAMTDFEVESGTTELVLGDDGNPEVDENGNPTGRYEVVGIESYGTPKARKDILDDYMGYAPFTDQYGKPKMGIKGLVPNYDDLDYNIKGLLAEYNLNMKWDPRVLILRATGFDDKTTNYHWKTNKAAFEKLWGRTWTKSFEEISKRR